MSKSEWLTLLQPLLIILVPLILSQVKKLLAADSKWKVIIPILAPIIAVTADQLQGLATGGTLGVVQSAVMGALAVFARELVDQGKKTFTSLLVLFALALSLTSCATSEVAKTQKALDVTGTALEVAGQQFVEVGKFFNQALDAKLITNDQYRAWAAFAKKFKQGYPPAVSAYKVAVSAGNLASAQEVEASIQPLISELAQFALQVYKILNKPTAWVLPDHPTDIVTSVPGEPNRLRLAGPSPQLSELESFLILYYSGALTPLMR